MATNTLLGPSDLAVQSVSFGCMSLTDNSKPNRQLLRKAAEHGIALFDTADIYQDGRNEMLVGEALAPLRQEVLIATKVGNQRQPDGTLAWNPSMAYILKSVENSLKRLGTDYIDLYQLHGGTIDDPIDETIEAFELLKKQGKIRWYGISSIRPNVIREYVERSNIVSVMMQYSLLDRRPEEAILGLLHERGIGTIVRGAVAGGLLAGKDPAPYLQFTESEVAKAAKAVATVASEMGVDRLDVALDYVFAEPAVSTVALGIRTPLQLDEAVQAMGAMQALSAEQRQTLRHAVREFYYEQHR